MSGKLVREKRVYLDFAAATPVRPEVHSVLIEATERLFGNASAIHHTGVAAKQALEKARTIMARLLKIRPTGIVFTGSGTESNNLAIIGTVKALLASGRPASSITILSTKIEHAATRESLAWCQSLGVVVKYCALAESGLIDLTSLETQLTDETALVTITYINSEIGVRQDIPRIARLIKKYNQVHQTNIKLHVDAAQAPLWEPCQFDGLGIDLLSLDAGKCYGPKGVGVLAMRPGILLHPVIMGGGQEFGLRAGTENVPAIMAAVEAFVIADRDRDVRVARVKAIRDHGLELLEQLPGVMLNGSRDARVVNNINVSILGVDTEFATVVLDEAGIEVSTKSACAGASGGGSQVVLTITGDPARATSTLRFTLGEETTVQDIKRAIRVLADHLTKIRISLPQKLS